MDVVISGVIDLLFKVGMVVALPFIMAALFKYAQKLGLNISAENQARLQNAAQSAILATEEWARTEAKKVLPEKITSQDKLDEAVSHMMAQIPGITEQEAADVIHAELPKIRAAMGDFLQATSKAVSEGQQ